MAASARRDRAVPRLLPGPDPARLVGSRITVTSALGRPELIVVGVAKSITDSAGGWVLPAEVAGLRAPRTPAAAQMPYRFRRAGTAAQIRADVAALGAALPPGALTGTQSYLTIKSQETRTISIAAGRGYRPGSCPARRGRSSFVNQR